MPSSLEPKGRQFLLVSMIAMIIIVGSLIAFYGYDRTFALWNVPTYHLPFLDLRMIAGAAESYSRGYDPAVLNPADPLHRKFNYPGIWYLVLGSGIDQSATVPIGIAVITLFIASVYLFPGRLTGPSIFCLLLTLVSPALMLAFARGNVDMLIFAAMTLSLLLLEQHPVSAFAILLMGILFKMIPVLGIGCFMDRGRNGSLKFIGGAILFTSVYLVLALKDMIVVFQNTVKSLDAAYGFAILPAYLQYLVHVRQIQEGPIILYRAVSVVAEMLRRFPFLPLAAAVFLIALMSYLGLRRRNQFEASDLRNLRAFWMGAGMYVGTFLIGSNFEYRLLFLLFTLPQLADWATKNNRTTRAVTILTLITLFVSLWHLVIQALMTGSVAFGTYLSTLMAQGANWALFAALIYLFAFSLPDWPFEDLRSLLERAVKIPTPVPDRG